MRRDQTAHETLIPLLVDLVGAQSYLEFGTHANQTIGKVRCPRRYGVDLQTTPCEGVEMFTMSTKEFIREKAATIAPFDFVFIDADHALEAVREDFLGIMPYVSPEGLVAVHDTNPEHHSDAAPGFCNNSWMFAMGLWIAGVEAVTLPFHPGLTITRRRVTWGPQP